MSKNDSTLSNQLLRSNESTLVVVKNLSFRYAGSDDVVLENVNIQIAEKEIVLIAGHSGIWQKHASTGDQWAYSAPA